MHNFSEADRKKKSGRIKLPDNPGNLSKEALSQLENAVQTAANNGCVTCPTGWKIARDAGVSRLDVGAMIDKLGYRVTECQLGFFKVEKTPRTDSVTEPVSDEVARRVEALGKQGELTCRSVFALAHELNVAPMCVMDLANARGYKLRQCQLGCF